jgi:hypothetical protein
MKLLTKLSLVSAIFAAIGTSMTFADDPQLQNRLAAAREGAPRSLNTPTIAVYAGGRGVGQVQSTGQRQRQDILKTFQAGNGPAVTYQVPAE